MFLLKDKDTGLHLVRQVVFPSEKLISLYRYQGFNPVVEETK